VSTNVFTRPLFLATEGITPCPPERAKEASAWLGAVPVSRPRLERLTLQQLAKYRSRDACNRQFGLWVAYYMNVQLSPRPPCLGAGIPKEMNMTMLVLNTLARLHQNEEGQGLVEYLLILALVAFAATAGMTSLASGLNSAFSQIGVILGSYIT
jgi:pilus assembly protein Flp/PilA